jgi:2-polyprenyl-3-methyl-5-hydroxy-6-metoxy-1,4-benzoquinol methylase
MGQELKSDFYDEVFENGGSEGVYLRSWIDTPWVDIWTNIARIVVERGKTNVLDLGCGPGQFASCFYENNIKNYTGIDFSEVAIDAANKLFKDKKNYTFLCSNILEFNFDKIKYDCVIATEFMEHIEDDILVLSKIKSKTLILISLPNCDSEGHVRYYPQEEDEAKASILERYSSICNIEAINIFYYENSCSKDYLVIMEKK